MESEARYTYVGAVLLGLVLALALAAVWLARTGARDDFRFYTIYFEHQSLEGLQVGGDVTMRGVKVGRVERYSLDRDNINRVRVTIRVERRTPVSDNTVAVVARNIVTGLARISLVTPGKPGPPLEQVPPGQDYPVIAEGRSGLDQLADAANRLAETGATTLESLNEVLAPENRAALAAALVNIRDVSAALNQRMGKIDEVAATFNRSAAEFGSASRAIAASIERMQTGLQPLTMQAETTLRDVSGAVQRLERETATLARRIDEVADTGTLEIRATAQELRASAEILARTADRLRDPRAALLGPGPAQLGPGEKLW